jgi:hypothetical protein
VNGRDVWESFDLRRLRPFANATLGKPSAEKEVGQPVGKCIAAGADGSRPAAARLKVGLLHIQVFKELRARGPIAVAAAIVIQVVYHTIIYKSRKLGTRKRLQDAQAWEPNCGEERARGRLVRLWQSPSLERRWKRPVCPQVPPQVSLVSKDLRVRPSCDYSPTALFQSAMYR